VSLVAAIVWIFTFVAVPALQNEADPGTVMMEAVSAGHSLGEENLGVEAVERALQLGIHVDAQDNAGWSALMYAAEEGLSDITDRLLRAGANPNLHSARGDTALMIAAECSIVRTRAGNVELRGLPAQMAEDQLAAPSKISSSLISYGADVNARRNDGRTALMNAAMLGWPSVVRLLLDAKADVNARDEQGRLAIDYADPGETTLIEMLRHAGSRVGSGLSGRTSCDAQKRLLELGYRAGKIDCLWGTSSSEALKVFQEDHGLAATGQLNTETIEALAIRP
jgi:ankyrin repeat protein